MSYKVFSKMLVNRIKHYLPDLIGEEQSSFVPGHQISDNIVMVQEVVHSIRLKKGLVSWMAIKVDLEKAYDRVRWDFLRDTLILDNFPTDLVDIIMSFVTTVNIKFCGMGSSLLISPLLEGCGRGILCPPTCLFYAWKG